MSYSRYTRRIHIAPVRKITKATTDIEHTLAYTDTIDGLAYKYYNDATLGWVIMNANKQYGMEFEIPIGATIRVPLPLDRVFKLWGIEGEL